MEKNENKLERTLTMVGELNADFRSYDDELDVLIETHSLYGEDDLILYETEKLSSKVEESYDSLIDLMYEPCPYGCVECDRSDLIRDFLIENPSLYKICDKLLGEYLMLRNKINTFLRELKKLVQIASEEELPF